MTHGSAAHEGYPLASMRITTLATALFALVLLATPATLAQSGGSFGSAPTGTPQATPPQPPTKSDPVMPEPGAPATAPSTPTPAAPAQPANLPSAADIFKKSVDAIGGEDAVRKHSAMRVKGKLGVAGMQQGDMEILMLAPNRFLTTINMAGLGKMEQGFDGTVGWTKNPMMGTQLLEGRTLDELRRSSDFYKDIDPSKLWKSATTKGVTTFINLPCYEVAVEGDMGNGSLFYGVDDGLARGMRMTVDTPMGKVPTTTSMVEYKDFDGLKIASKTEIEAMGAKQVMTVDSVDFTPVDPKLFDLPPDVKALVDGGGKKAPASGKTSGKPAGKNGSKPGTNGGTTPPPPPAKP